MPDKKMRKQKPDVKAGSGEILTVQQLRQEMAKVSMAIKAGKEKNTRKVFNLRKKLARILTVKKI